MSNPNTPQPMRWLYIDVISMIEGERVKEVLPKILEICKQGNIIEDVVLKAPKPENDGAVELVVSLKSEFYDGHDLDEGIENWKYDFNKKLAPLTINLEFEL